MRMRSGFEIAVVHRSFGNCLTVETSAPVRTADSASVCPLGSVAFRAVGHLSSCITALVEARSSHHRIECRYIHARFGENRYLGDLESAAR